MTLRKPGGPPAIIAHRGGAGLAPENTLAAVRIAKRLGVDGIEIDVRAGRSGEAVVIHDPTLERTTTGRGRVAEYDRRALSRMDAGRKFDRRFHRIHVPILREVLRASRPIPLLVEAKEASVVEEVVREVARARAWSTTVVMSFHTAAIEAAKRRTPRLRVAHLVKLGWMGRWTGRAREVVARAREMGACGVCVDVRGCTPRLVEAAHASRIPVWVWTVDTPARADQLVRIGADALITNRPDVLRARMAQWEEWMGHGRYLR